MIMVTAIPNTKVKINELLIQWLSNDKIYEQLQDDLQSILNGKVPEVVPTKQLLSRAVSPPLHKHPVSPRGSPRISNSPVKQQTGSNRPLPRRTPSPAVTVPEPRKKQSPHKTSVIPKFYFPMGKPFENTANAVDLSSIKKFFGNNNDTVTLKQFAEIMKLMELPLYWKRPLYEACTSSSTCTYDQFHQVFEHLVTYCHDHVAKFVRILSKGKRSYLVAEDFTNLVQDVIDSHPGMSFLDNAPEFHARYIETVVGRIMYNVNRSWTKKITMKELRESNFLKVLSTLEDESDINQVSDYFSYEHFYVIYCKFWELDTDHDLRISLEDIMKHADRTVNPRALERLFKGTVTFRPTDVITYSDFIWFLLAEEDKTHNTAIEYWFRVMDLDGDGFISLYELEYFYQAQLEKMRCLGVEECSVLDCICQAIDIVKPKNETKISLSDIKKCQQPSLFFNIFLNIQKFLDHELKDPSTNKEGELPLSDWDRYAAREYEELIADEEDNMNYDDDDFEEDFQDEDEDEEDSGAGGPSGAGKSGIGGEASYDGEFLARQFDFGNAASAVEKYGSE